MNQLTILLLLLCASLSQAQNINFPDANFRAALIEKGVDLNSDGQISVAEAEAQDSLILPYSGIRSIEGIEHFKNVLELDFHGNFSLREVKIRGLQKLIKLKIYENNISELELEDLPELRSFVCSDAGLVMDTLDVSNLPNLRYLYCYWNAIKAIELAPNSPIFQIYCQRNPIEEIDLAKCPNLERLYINKTNISEIDLSLVPKLKHLDCSETPIRSFDISNNLDLTHLLCSALHLNNLDISAHILLEKLHCADNLLTDIDVANHSALVDLNVGNNNLTTIDVTNNLLLEKLVVSNNNLSVSGLDISNNFALTDFDCARCQLGDTINLSHCQDLRSVTTSINPINELLLAEQLDSLRVLNCNANGLKHLDVFSYVNLETLDCGSNNLIHLDLRNNRYLENVIVTNNPLVTLFAMNGSRQDISLRQLPELEYVCRDIQDTLADRFFRIPSGTIFNSYCYYNPEGHYNNIIGKAQFDYDGNGCGEDDPTVSNLLIGLSDTTANSGQFLTNSDGDYKLSIGPGSYTIQPVLEKPDVFSITPDIVQESFDSSYEERQIDFCISSQLDFCDLDISIMPIGPARPGLSAQYKISYSNIGTTPLSGRIKMTRDATVTSYLNASPIPNFTNATTLFWDFAELFPFETREIVVNLELNRPTDDPPLNGGDFLEYKVEAQVIKARDEYLFFETCLSQQVVNSFDPNDKTCLQGDRILEEMVGEYISYLIRFENTGSAEAINITITDTLDDIRLIPSTLKVLDSSHSMFSRIENGNVVQFIFENIWLSHEDESNDGYVLFKIKTRDNMVIGDEVINNADIYFDYNYPVITDEYVTTVSPLSSLVKLSEDKVDLILFPNPSDDQLTLWSEENMYEAVLTDIKGRKVLERKFDGRSAFSLDISQLPAGPYHLLIKGETQVITKKVVIAR